MTETGNKSFDRIRAVFEEAYRIGLGYTDQGKVADYIPELAKANRDDFGISMIDGDLRTLSLGDCEKRFSMQSVSKVILLCAALLHCGFEETFSHVMMEPSGDSFNSILKLDLASNRPYNPMINAGAIETASLISGDLSFGDLLGYARELCADPEICLDEAVYASESKTGDRNRAIVYLLKSKGVLMDEPERTLDLYFRMCSLSVNARSLANLGLVIANGGLDPFTGRRLIPTEHVRTLKVIMFTCGMYDYSGKFSVRVGVPSKSGVGGGLVCAAKGPMGIGLYGPSLDAFGNSKAAVKAMEHISRELELHSFY
ncbi:MAG: glutaminase A [Clostridia bacterium]|nr:glutaminase A [Clostridia bacterium]